jgi:cobalamin biosynthesis protein CobD/CbiB
VIRPRGASVVAALLADGLIREPPEAAHPIVLMGRAISAFEELVLAFKGERRLRLAGLFLAAALPTLSFVLARLALLLAPAKLRWLLEVGLLSTSLSMRPRRRARASWQ